MKNTTTDRQQNWKRFSALLCAALLASATGCICINISVTGPGTGSGSVASRQDEAPTPGGGVFVPVSNTRASGGQSTVCNHPVKTVYVRHIFDDNGQQLLTQTPDTSVLGFQGYLVDTNTGLTVSNNQYYLQWFVNSLPQNNGCASNVNGSTTDVGFTVTAANLPHRFTTFFKPGSTHPIVGHRYKLKGIPGWTE